MTVYPEPQASVDPYATEEPIPYEPDHPDNLANQGPLDSTPATTDVLLTPDEAWAQAEQSPPVETEPLPPGNPFESPAFVIGKCRRVRDRRRRSHT